MSGDKTDVLRLPKKHTSRIRVEPTVEDGARLVREQSVRNAVMGALIVIILFTLLWVMLTDLVNRVFPWMTVLLGLALGHVVRRAGQGLDWRFPAIAATSAVLGSLVSNIVVAAAATAAEFGTGVLHILRAVTPMTWPDFFREDLTPADAVFALFAAIIAAVYAKRRLSRRDYLAYRKWLRSNDTAD